MPLLAFQPLLEESDLGSLSYRDLIKHTVELYGKTLDNVKCLVGDNCSVNISLGNITGIPMLGCMSHRFNLAVEEWLRVENFGELIKKVDLEAVLFAGNNDDYWDIKTVGTAYRKHNSPEDI